MKRKVALLLSLVMILAMLPMNAFGRGISASLVPHQGMHTFHLIFDMHNLGQGNRLDTSWPLLSGLPGDTADAGPVTILFPITLNQARFNAAGGTGGGHSDRRFITTRGANTSIPVYVQTLDEAPVPPNTVVPTGQFAIFAEGSFIAESSTLLYPSYNPPTATRVSIDAGLRGSANDGDPVPTFENALVFSSRTVDNVTTNGVEVIDNATLRVEAGSAINQRSVTTRGSRLTWPTNSANVRSFISGSFPPPLPGPNVINDVYRLTRDQWLELPITYANGGETGNTIRVRFIPRWDPTIGATGAWSNTSGWLDIASDDLTFVPTSNHIVTIPIELFVEGADATVSVHRVQGNDLLNATPVFLDQRLFAVDATLPAQNIHLMPVTPATFSNVIVLNTLSIRETWAQRIRNISVTEANAMHMANFPITQAMSLRYSPLPAIGVVPMNHELLFRITWDADNDATNVLAGNSSRVGEGFWYVNRGPAFGTQGFSEAHVDLVIEPSRAVTTVPAGPQPLGLNRTQHVGRAAASDAVTPGFADYLTSQAETAAHGRSVGRVWWYQNNVRVPAGANAPGILVEAGPAMAGAINVAMNLWEFPQGSNPFIGNLADHARVEAGRLQFGGGGDATTNLGWFTLRLVAQEHYNWSWATEAGFTHARFNQPEGNTAFRVFSPGTTGADVGNFQLNRIGDGWNHGNNFNARYEDVGGVQRHVLYIRINAGDPTLAQFAPNNGVRNHSLHLGQLDLENLRLFPTAQALTSGDVMIDMYWGWSSRVGAPYLAYRQMFAIQENVVVGTRGDANVTFGIVGEAPDMRTGYLGNRFPGITPLLHGQTEISHPASGRGQNPNNNNLAHYRGQATAQVQLVETVPGLLSSNWSNPIYFTFGDGVRILGATVNAGTTTNTNLINNWQGWLDAENMRWAAGVQHVQISPRRVQINLPVNPFASVNNPLTIGVTFHLSLESDFYVKHGTEAIEVTVSGTGVAALPESQRTITVGYAVDPIEVSLDSEATAIETDPLFGIPSTPLPDVRVTVRNEHVDVLANNSQVWLYLVDEHGERTDLNLDPNRVTVTPEGNYGGLQLAPPRILQHPHPNYLRHGIAVTVQRQPSGLPADGTFDLVFSNLYVSGNLRPGMDYQIAVSGTRIAQNDQVVRAYIHHNEGRGTSVSDLNVGTFTSLPYALTILTQGAGGLTIDGPGGIFGGGTLSLHADMGPFPTNVMMSSGIIDPQIVDVPFFLWTNPNGGDLVSMLNPRVFAHFIDGILDFDENGGVVSFSGFDANGNIMEVELTIGSTDALVNGQTVDIANFSRNSGPDGSIATINDNGRTFVPLRFLTRAFGIYAGWDEGSQMVRLEW